jgi:hypothetical protein
MIINILKTLPWYFVGLAVLGVPSILLIISLFVLPDSESFFFGSGWVANIFMDMDGILEDGQDPYNATVDFNTMFAWLNINLLIVTLIISLGWSIGSHFLNIDEPGKAKFFGLYWIIVSAVCIGAILAVCFVVLDFSSAFAASQDITTTSQTNMIILSTIYYGAMYWLAVILGTARQARSAVLLANKLPARNFL